MNYTKSTRNGKTIYRRTGSSDTARLAAAIRELRIALLTETVFSKLKRLQVKLAILEAMRKALPRQ